MGVKAPSFAAETKTVKMGSDNGQLVFVPDEIKICKGDTVTWVNNKGGPHNVVFDEEAIPAGVSQESISMDDQLGEEGETFSKKFDVAGEYKYYCEPHRGAGMNAALTVALMSQYTDLGAWLGRFCSARPGPKGRRAPC